MPLTTSVKIKNKWSVDITDQTVFRFDPATAEQLEVGPGHVMR